LGCVELRCVSPYEDPHVDSIADRNVKVGADLAKEEPNGEVGAVPNAKVGAGPGLVSNSVQFGRFPDTTKF
jgi:hypothetical protein